MTQTSGSADAVTLKHARTAKSGASTSGDGADGAKIKLFG